VNYTKIILSQLDVLMNGTPSGIATKLMCETTSLSRLNEIEEDVVTATIILRIIVYRAMMLNYTRAR
jgi:hypothetical protein